MKNLSAISNNKDIATKEYVDTAVSGRLATSKVKTINSTTSGDVYDVTYINTMLGNIESILTTLTTGGGVS